MAKLIRIETATDTYNVPSTAKVFAYDGCHKIYIIENEEDMKTMKELGYHDDQFIPLENLYSTFCDSCGLRFIDNASLTKAIVAQCEEYAKFVYDNGSYDEYDMRDEMGEDDYEEEEEEE